MDTLIPLFALLVLMMLAPGLAGVRVVSRAPWLVTRHPIARLSVLAGVTVLPLLAWLCMKAGHGEVGFVVAAACVCLLWVWLGELFTGAAR